jgi:hypothetical protein
VAFAIVAAAMVALLHTFSQGMRSADVSVAELTALMQARSLMDSLGRERPLREGEETGTFENGLRWTVATAPYGFPDGAESDSPSGLAAYRVEVTVSPPAGRTVTLRSLRLTVLQP